MGKCSGFFSNFNVVLSYLQSDLIKKQRAFKIGLVSIFLVVWFTTMLMNLISLNCLIFMRLIEDSVGEADFVFTPFLSTQDVKYRNSSFESLILNKDHRDTSYFDIKFIDFANLKEKLKDIKTLEGIAPRWLLQGNTTNTYDNKTSWAVSNLLILDSELENKQGMGRKEKIHKLNEGECYVSKSLFDSLKLNYNDNNIVTIDVKLSALIQALGKIDESMEEDETEEYFRLNQNNNRLFKKSKNVRELNDIKYNFNLENEDENFNNLFEEVKNQKINFKEILNDENREQNMKNLLHYFLNNDKNGKFLNNNKINVDINKFIDIFQINEAPKDINYPLSMINDPISNKIPYIKALNLLTNSQNLNSLDNLIEIDKEANTFKFKDLLNSNSNNNYNNYYDNDDINNTNEESNKKIPIYLSEIIECFNEEELDSILSFKLTIKIRQDISSSSGKWPSASGNVVAVDAKFMNIYLQRNFERIARIISDKLESEFIYDVLEQMSKNILKNFDIYKYTLSVNAVLKDKFAAYSKTGSKLRVHMAKQADEIMKTIGYDYPITITAPIFDSYRAISLPQIMLVNIFRAIMVFLWILSVILVYSLMLGNVDERTYEFGMLRSMGFKKMNLILLIIIQGFLFAIPGIILGFLTAYISNNYIEFLLNIYSGLTMPYFLNGTTIGLGTGVGFLIVLISSYFPIKKALDANLKETLTIFNKKIGDMVVSMVKLNRLGISPSSLVASLILIIIGISTYYIGPSSFFKLNPDIFIFIMIMILIIMILGLIVITQVFMPKIQEFLLFIIMLIAFKDKNLHFLVKKNLVCHAKRNKKVSIMFMVALSFVIFAGCTLNLVVEFIRTFTKSALGGDAAFWLTGIYDSLNQNVLEEYMKQTREKYPNLIYNYTWVSGQLRYLIGKTTRLGSLAGNPNNRRKISAIDKNLIYSGYQELYLIGDYDHKLNHSNIEGTKKVDIVSMLYLNDHVPPILPNDSLINFPIDPNGTKFKLNMQLNMIVAEGISKHYAIGPSNPASLKIPTRHSQRIPCKIVGLAKKLPGFPAYSSYFTLAFLTSGLISMNQMKELVDREIKIYPQLNATFYKNKGITHTPDGLPKQGLFIKFYSNTEPKLRSMVFSEVKNIFDKDGAIAIILDDIIKTTNKAQKIMGYIFLVLGIIALILSFFLIWTSFYNNIKDNICEYGVMRAVGLTKRQATRMFLYEALAIITSSIITGTIIGVVISITLVLQFNVFVELPFIFKFPTQLYLVLVILGLSLGMLGSYYPVLEVNHMSLVKIMKGLSE